MYKDNKTDRPACWDWEIPLGVYDLSARARTCKDLSTVLNIWQPGCAICSAVLCDILDHDHETGFIRGLLCVSCNNAEARSNKLLIVNYRHMHPAFLLGVEVSWTPPSGTNR